MVVGQGVAGGTILFFSFSLAFVPYKPPDSHWLKKSSHIPLSSSWPTLFCPVTWPLKVHGCLWPMLLDSGPSLAPFSVSCPGLVCSPGDAKGPHLALLGCLRWEQALGDACHAKWCFDNLILRWIQGSCQCNLSPSLLFYSLVSLLLYSWREIFSAYFWFLFIYLFNFFPPAVMGAGFAVVAKHISFLFLLSLS